MSITYSFTPSRYPQSSSVSSIWSSWCVKSSISTSTFSSSGKIELYSMALILCYYDSIMPSSFPSMTIPRYFLITKSKDSSRSPKTPRDSFSVVTSANLTKRGCALFVFIERGRQVPWSKWSLMRLSLISTEARPLETPWIITERSGLSSEARVHQSCKYSSIYSSE